MRVGGIIIRLIWVQSDRFDGLPVEFMNKSLFSGKQIKVLNNPIDLRM